MPLTTTPPDSYSRVERLWLGPARTILAAAYGPIARGLGRLGVSPNAVSLSQIPLGIAVVVLIPTQPRLAAVAFVLALMADGIDGALARATGRSTSFGALLDQYADHIREAIVVGGFALHGALDPFIAVLYAVAYPGTNVTLYLCNARGVPVPFALKTYMTFYPAMALYLLAGIDILDVAGAISVASMSVVVAMGLWRLRGAMDQAR
ncbi:MAG: CDP-alcohol phosphatidyltransferase family protein [Chloroflexi bacterium]|nr:CDP-alcohol phosphatidyltransferase family protein [Chloroflexota bacterium]MBI2982635.1 CDP-alcohol phosphatidyltransferase family protein [Chloroflexota bacterium]